MYSAWCFCENICDIVCGINLFETDDTLESELTNPMIFEHDMFVVFMINRIFTHANACVTVVINCDGFLTGFDS